MTCLYNFSETTKLTIFILRGAQNGHERLFRISTCPPIAYLPEITARSYLDIAGKIRKTRQAKQWQVGIRISDFFNDLMSHLFARLPPRPAGIGTHAGQFGIWAGKAKLR